MEAEVTGQHGVMGENHHAGNRHAASATGRRMKNLGELAMAIGSRKSLDELLSMTAQALAQSLGSDLALLCLLSASGGAPARTVTHGVPDESAEEIAAALASVPSSRQAIEEQHPVFFSATDAMGLPPVVQLVAEKYGFSGWLAVPILDDVNTIGLAHAIYIASHPRLSEDDEIFAMAVAAHCALAIEKERMRDEARELDSLKDEFLSEVAHALKSPLTALKGYSQLLLRKVAKHPEIAVDLSGLEAIESQTNRLQNVVNRLLDLGRIQMGRYELALETVELVSLVREAVENARGSTGNLVLDFQTDSDAVTGNWDRKGMESVVNALLDNAVKYTHGGGRIEVNIACRDGQAVVSIRDYGIGVLKEEQVHLFERYFRSSERGVQSSGGLGLGLYVSKRIVEAHGGRIWAESEPKSGSNFSFSLPLKKQA